MKLQVLADQRFSCHSCSHCCRHWHVELLDEEVKAVPALAWPEGDPLRGVAATMRFQGKTYLAHTRDGACVFLNEGNGRCRIHEQFGLAKKPFGCRLYPFHLVATFPGTVSVTGRYDCPSIRGNKGEAFAEQKAEIEKLAREVELPGGFDEELMDHLGRKQIEAVTEFACMLLGAFQGDREKALFLHFLGDWLAEQPVEEFGREALGEAFEPLQKQVAEAVAQAAGKPNWAHRLAFRALLSQHLRRDEDVLDGRANRVGRALGIAAFTLGGGSLRGMGKLHAAGRLHEARLFGDGGMDVAPGAMDLHWRMVKEKLATTQFMGRGKIGRDFLSGLRALALLYPLVLATARCAAGGRGSARVEGQDVEFAVAAIEYGFGRSAVLLTPMSRYLETLLLERKAFVGLVARNVVIPRRRAKLRNHAAAPRLVPRA